MFQMFLLVPYQAFLPKPHPLPQLSSLRTHLSNCRFPPQSLCPSMGRLNRSSSTSRRRPGYFTNCWGQKITRDICFLWRILFLLTGIIPPPSSLIRWSRPWSIMVPEFDDETLESSPTSSPVITSIVSPPPVYSLFSEFASLVRGSPAPYRTFLGLRKPQLH